MAARVEEPLLESDDAHEISPQAKSSESAEFPDEKAKSTQPDIEVTVLDEDEIEITLNDGRSDFYTKYRPFILGGLAALILGWWISATVLPETRHRW
jgi:CNT family concentrative nucleoside transporter